MNRRVSISIPVLFILGISLLLAGCLNLANDVTPPPGVIQTDLVVNTQVPTLEPTLKQTQEQSQPDETTPEEFALGVVNVEVIDFTGGTLLDQGLDVRLDAYDQFEQVYQETLTLPSTGLIDFIDVPFLADRVYFVSIAYGGAVYRSEMIGLAPDSSELSLQVQIFDTTTDDSGLTIDRIHVFVEFPQPDLIQIGESYIISNLGAATVVAEVPGQPTVSFPLPDGAAAIEFANGVLGQRYIQTQDGFGDTVNIPPGTGVYEVLVYYTLPYQRNKLDFSQIINYPVDAVVVMTPVNQVKVKGNFLEDLGIQSIPSSAVHVYVGEALSRGEELQFRLSGKPDSALNQEDSLSIQSQGYLITLTALGTVMFLVGIWLFFRNRRMSGQEEDQKDLEEDRDQILDKIISLEDLFDSGEITEKSFLKKRQELKKKLSDLVQDKNSTS